MGVLGRGLEMVEGARWDREKVAGALVGIRYRIGRFSLLSFKL